MLGAHCVYHTHTAHLAKTVKTIDGEQVETSGSLHHPELADFAGLVTRVHVDEKGKPSSYDVVIFPPGRDSKHVENVKAGKGPNEIELVR